MSRVGVMLKEATGTEGPAPHRSDLATNSDSSILSECTPIDSVKMRSDQLSYFSSYVEDIYLQTLR
jgi:hypothetical protein